MRVEILHCDVPNHNGRTYTKQVAEQIIEQSKTKPEILGELVDEKQYPATWGYARADMAVSLGRISHSVKNLRLEGDVLVGDATVLPTPMGQVLQPIAFHPSVKFIPRGAGTVSAEGVVSDYTLVSVDAWYDHGADDADDVGNWHNEGGR